MLEKARVPATLVALVGILVIILSLSFTPCDAQLSQAAKNISKREAQLVDIIEHHSLSFDIAKFAKDPILVQSGSYVRYANPKAKDESNMVVLSKKHPDYGKDSIVLSSADNRFAIPTPRGTMKRQFILLRRAALQGRNPEETKYHTSIIYVRNLYPNDTNKQTFNVEGVDSVVEFDIWETRPRKFFAGWSNCDFSMLFTCTSMEDIETDANERAEQQSRRKRQAIEDEAMLDESPSHSDFIRRRRQANAEAAGAGGAGGAGAGAWGAGAKKPELPALTPFQSEPGYDPGVYHDLYLDFDLHRFDVMYKTEIIKAMKVEVSQLSGKVKPTPKPKPKVLTPPPRTTTTEKPKKKHGRKKRSPFLGGLLGGGGGGGGGGKKKKAKAKANAGVKRRGGKPKDVNSKPGGGGGDFGADADVEADVGGGLLGGLFGGGGKKKKGKKGGGSLNPLGGIMDAASGMMGGLLGGGGGGNPLGGIMNAASGVMGAATGALGGMMGGGNPLGGIMDAASGIMGGVMGGGNPLGGIMDAASGVMGAATGALGGMMGGGNPLGGIMDAASGVMGGLMGGGNPLGGIMDAASGVMGGLMGGGNPLGGIMDAASGVMGGLMGGGNPLGGIMDAASGVMGGLMGGDGPLGGIMDAASGMMGGLMGGDGPLGGIMDAASGVMGGLMGGGNPLGGIMDAATGMMGGLMGGDGPLGGIMDAATGMMGGLMGGDGPLGGIMDAATGMMGGLMGGANPLGGIMDAATGVMGGLMGGGNPLEGVMGAVQGAAGAMTGMAGGLANMMGGLAGGAGGPLSMLKDVMGPASLLLGPVTGALGAANEMVKSLPGMGIAVGHNIIGALAPIAESMGIAKVMEAVGMGPIINTAAGIADSIVSTGDMLLNTWDIIGNGMIEQAAGVLEKVGVPPEVAKLAALGGQLAFNSFTLKDAKAAWVGLRLGVDAAGTVLNGGKFSGKGLYGKGTVPPNSVTVYGTLYLGAEGGRYFFFPQGSMIRCTFQGDGEDTTVEGWFKTQMSGGPDAFFPDDDGSSSFGKTGRILPLQYEQEDPESEPGIVGTFEEGFKFVREGKKVTGIYTPGDPDWTQNVWLPGEMGTLTARPASTPVGKKILYGYLFNGIEDSPHVFISEGDTVSGVFVPVDPERKEITETPHGILTPTHPAGHAIFVADDPREVVNINELRGVFMPDAMNLAGGISGRLSKAEDCNCDVKFSFILDKPAIEFMYVPENVHVKNVWSPYLTPEEWTYQPPQEPEGGAKDDEDDEDVGAAKTRRKRQADADAEKPREVSGLKVKSKKGISFFPEMFPFDGVMLAMSKEKRYSPIGIRIILEKPDEPMKFAVLKKTDPNEKLPSPLVGLFMPVGFPKEDGFAGHLFMNEDQAGGTFKLAVEMSAHFWTPDEQIWTPVGFKEKMMQGEKAAEEVKKEVEAKEEKKAEKETKKKEELKKDQEEKEVAMKEAGKKPKPKEPTRKVIEPPKRPGNLITGKLQQELEGSGSPEMTEDENENSDEYVRGFFLKAAESPEPVFVEDTGALGVFSTDQGAAKAFYFPKRGKLESLFIPEQPGSIPPGTVGQFFTLDDEDKPSKGFIVGKFNGKTLETEGMEAIPGWEMADQEPLQPEDIKGTQVPAEYFVPSMRGLKYALVDIGGGFKGVIIGGGKALDDPNNPIFQEFLHYRAAQTGDVNPYGRVAILNPIMRTREKGGKDNAGDGYEGSFTLPLGLFYEDLQQHPNGVMAQVLNGFSLSNWEYPDETEFEGGAKRAPNMMGSRANVANMLDFRMFLFKKYSCKKAEVEGKKVHMFAPKGSEGFLKLKAHAKPLKEWLELVAQTGSSMIVPEEAGIAGVFSAQYNIDVESIAPFERPAGEGVPPFTPGQGMKETGDWKTSAPFLEWGDDNSCDVIEMDDFMNAQALGEMGDEASTKSSNGIALGYEMIQGRGRKISYFKVAKKLLANFNKKMEERGDKAADQKHNAGQTTDLTGEQSGAADQAATKRKRQIEIYQSRLKRQGVTEAPAAPGTPQNRHLHAKSMPGWKTQHRKLADNATLSDNGIFFYGLGNCKWDKLPDESLLKSKKPNHVIEFYLRIMRINCMEKAEKRMVDLVNQGFLRLAKTGMYFDVPEENKIVQSTRLTPTEIKKLSLAFEFHAFTKTYAKRCVQEDRGRGVIIEPHGMISRSMDFLTEMALYIINTGRRVSPNHAIRLNRNMLMSLRSVMSKLQQDHIVLETDCAGCQFDKDLTNGDRFRAISLSEFIIHGLLPYNMGHQKLKPLFASFEKRNKKAIDQRIEEFSRQFPDKVPKRPEGSK